MGVNVNGAYSRYINVINISEVIDYHKRFFPGIARPKSRVCLALNFLSRKDQKMILTLFWRNSGIADIAEITGHSTTTIRRYLGRYGEALTAVLDRLVRGISPRRIECDEIHSMVYARYPSRVKRGSKTAPPANEIGAVWTWTAIDPDSKLLIGFRVGSHEQQTGMEFFADISTRIVSEPIISTDGLVSYPGMVETAFGTTAQHVVIEKQITSWFNRNTGESNQYVKFLGKRPSPNFRGDIALASTSLVERMNATIRDMIPRFTRRTYRFSKKLANHVHAHAVFAMYYNFVRPHGGLKGHFKHHTPAMAAGLTSKIWTVDQVLDQIDEYWADKDSRPPLKIVSSVEYLPLKKGETSPWPYFVMLSHLKHHAKVHTGACRNCRQGRGRGENAVSTEWYAFKTLDDAMKAARTLAPLDFSKCSLCVVGKYKGARKHATRPVG